MWSREYTLDTEADPESVWRLLSDVDGWDAWNDGIETIMLDGPLAFGTTFRMTPTGEDALTSTIAEVEPNRRLTDVTDLGELMIRVVHQLEPRATGGTSIAYRVEVTGSAAEDAGEEIGTAVSSDFPDVLAALAAVALARTT